jgi:outer membrane protein OmpA-like peptidoglycan-associated protein
MLRKIPALVVISVWVLGLAQSRAQSSVPIYRVVVVGRTIPAISYRTLSGSTEIGFAGTSLMPDAFGIAKVTSRPTATRIQAQFRDLGSPSAFGPEYLTYVLWAISPDGHPMNVAEIIPHNGKAQADVTVDSQAFGLIVTAEPYFAVTLPSNVVVLQNEVTNKTKGKVEQLSAKSELLRRGQYVANVSAGEVHPFTMETKTPLALYEAENAVNIARWAGAEQHATGTFKKAVQLLGQAQAYQEQKPGQKPVIMTAREAVQTAEDARTIALRVERREAEQEARRQQQQAAEERIAAARRRAEQEAVARANAAAAQAAAEAARAKAQAQAERAQVQAEQARLAAAQARARAEQAQQSAQQAQNQQLAMRAKLLQQLNSILQTRETSSGLVVTMSHVLFNTGRYTLLPDTRVTLAKIAGVLLAYPGLKIQVNGYTDNTGTQQINQELSDQRADAVRDFLVQQGIPSSSVSARGLGESNPVAPNDTAMGRALNRRVEIVISGNAIGIPVAPVSG